MKKQIAYLIEDLRDPAFLLLIFAFYLSLKHSDWLTSLAIFLAFFLFSYRKEKARVKDYMPSK